MEEFKRFVKEFLWDEELLQSDAATEDDDDEEENGKGGEDEDSSSSGPDDDSAFGRLATANVRRPPSPQLLGNDDMRKLADFGRTLKALDSQSSGGGQGESKRRQQTESNKAEAAETTQPSSEENDDDDVEVQVPRFARYAGGAKDIAKPAPAVSVHAHAVAAATAEPEIQVPRFARYSGGAKVTAAATGKAPAVKAPAVQAAVVKAEGAEGAEETEVAEEADGAVELCLDFEIVLPAGRKLGMTMTHNTTHAVRGKIGCKVTHVDEGGAAVEAAGQICKKCLETKCDTTCPGVPSIIPHDWVIGVNSIDVSDDPRDDVIAVIKAAMATGEPVTMRFRRSEESEAARVAIYLHARSIVLAREMRGTDGQGKEGKEGKEGQEGKEGKAGKEGKEGGEREGGGEHPGYLGAAGAGDRVWLDLSATIHTVFSLKGSVEESIAEGAPLTRLFPDPTIATATQGRGGGGGGGDRRGGGGGGGEGGG